MSDPVAELKRELLTAAERQLTHAAPALPSRAAGSTKGRRRRRWRLVAAAAVLLLGGLLVTPALGIGNRLLDLIQDSPPPRQTREPVWSPDGRTIAFVGGSDLSVVNADGTGKRRLAGNQVPGSRTGGRMSSPAWSPDGGKILFLSDKETRGDYCFRVYVVNADGSEERLLTHGKPTLHGCVGDFSPAWSPDGRRIAFVRATGFLSPLGEVWVMNADGTGQRRLTRRASGWPYAALAWSPDGQKLAFTSDRDGNAEVYSINADGSGVRRLTNSPKYDGDATWSPDGRKLVFVSNRDGDSEVYVMNADGSGQRRIAKGGS